MKTISFFFALVQTSIKASISRRGAFLIESMLMILNNFIFFAIWWIFFREFHDVGGWGFQEMVVLMIVGTGSYGLMLIFFGGVRNLSKMVLSGDLDSFMTQPKNILLHIAGSTSFSRGWGQLGTVVLLILLEGLFSPCTLLLLLFSMLSGCLVFTSVGIIAHSFPFWFGAVDGISKKYCEALFLFALYPTNIYSGILQVVMFTLIPAGIIGYLPVELVREFSWAKLLILALSAGAIFLVAVAIFYKGLRRYESGNQFGVKL